MGTPPSFLVPDYVLFWERYFFLSDFFPEIQDGARKCARKVSGGSGEVMSLRKSGFRALHDGFCRYFALKIGHFGWIESKYGVFSKWHARTSKWSNRKSENRIREAQRGIITGFITLKNYRRVLDKFWPKKSWKSSFRQALGKKYLKHL